MNLQTMKWIGDFDKKKVNCILKELLGDFSELDHYIGNSQEIIQAADQIMNHQFDVLGSGLKKLECIDWHTDFKSGYRWPPGKFYKDYVRVDLTNDADIKVVWDLNLFHHFLWLGQAYLLTKDEKYTKEFIAQFNRWNEENALMRSINWSSAMYVAIRAINLLYALNFFIHSDLIMDDFIKKYSSCLYAHGYFVMKNLEKSFPDSNNHYLANLSSLLFLGSYFIQNKEGRKWFCFAQREYYNEIRSQVLPSGVHFERSTSYQRLVIELLFYPYLLLKRLHLNVPIDIRYRLEKMFDFVLYYLKPDGKAPLIGDEDTGRLLPFCPVKNMDHRYLLSIAAVEFKRSLYKKYSAGYVPDCYFLSGPESKKIFDSIPETEETLASKNFSDAGFCILRNEKGYMFINNSGVAKYPDQSDTYGSHAHADMLSFELAIGDISFIVDPGTYVYSSSPLERNLFRSTKMHNTVTFDDRSQHVLPENNLFKTMNIGKPIEHIFIENPNMEEYIGSHDGYMKLAEPVIHQRKIQFHKGDLNWEINDELSGKGTHLIHWYFHFHSDIDIELVDHGVIATSRNKGGNRLRMNFESPFPFSQKIEDGFISPSYGIKRKAKVLVLWAQTSCPCTMKIRIAAERLTDFS